MPTFTHVYEQRDCHCRNSIHPGFAAPPDPLATQGTPRLRCGTCSGATVINSPPAATGQVPQSVSA